MGETQLQYLYHLSNEHSPAVAGYMRKGLTEVFDDTLNGSLNATLEAILGPKVRDEFYSILSRNGIPVKEVPARFDDVVRILTQTFGVVGWKVVVYKVIGDLHREYSQRTDFSFDGTLRDKLLALRERVVSNHLWPKHSQDADSFFDKEPSLGEEGSASDSGSQGSWSGLYRYKRGVNSSSNPAW